MVVALLLTSPDGGVTIAAGDGKALLRAARLGDSAARARIRSALLENTALAKADLASDSIPDGLSTGQDKWALPLLRDAALKGDPGPAQLSLVAWWKINGGKDDSLPREVLAQPNAPEMVKDTAVELLLPSGDPTAVKEKEAKLARSCAEAKPAKHLGLVWRRPAVLSDPNSTEFDFVVDHVCPNGRAAKSGLQPGDRVASVNGTACGAWVDCFNLIVDTAKLQTPVTLGIVGADGKPATRTVPGR